MLYLHSLREAEEVFKALSTPVRLRIMEMIYEDDGWYVKDWEQFPDGSYLKKFEDIPYSLDWYYDFSETK